MLDLNEYIEKYLSEEQYPEYTRLRQLLLDCELALDKKAYDEVLMDICELLPTHKEEIITKANEAFELRLNDENYLTPDEISDLLD
jgi:3-methyladenine DNA glycosylase AlkD